MMIQFSAEDIIRQSGLDKDLKNIAEKVINKERLTPAEGVLLFEKGEVGYLGALANHVRER
ncbi:MAG: aminofutalosine synthase MqnE, partial [Taibaiella sp.]|nr:aminofutalosine synthase MqnE [Taibaiella sp.]